MTTTPITPDRLSEIAVLCGRLRVLVELARDGRGLAREWELAKMGPLVDAIPELLAEVARLQAKSDEAEATAWRALGNNARLRADLDHATAHDGDHLSKASRLRGDTVMSDRDALRLEVVRLKSEIDHVNAWEDVHIEAQKNANARISELEVERDRRANLLKLSATNIDRLIATRDAARAGIKMVFQLIDSGDLELVHWTGPGDPDCPEDDTCTCRIRRFMLLLQLAMAGPLTPEAINAMSLLAKLPPPGPHDRADCPCGHALGTTGVCGGCNCADYPP